MEQLKRHRAVAPSSRMYGHGTSFGTFGELLQGVLPDGTDFLVTLPITLQAQAFFAIDPTAATVSVYPSHKCKSQRLAAMILDHFGLHPGGLLTLQSGLPEGKGLASSSADLVATSRAIQAAYRVQITPALLQRLMKEIEPTDGVMYDGVVAFCHRKVELREFLGQMPPMTILGIDEGGEIDTIAFNHLPKPFDEHDRALYAALLESMRDAIRRRDLATVGRIATRSSELNQKLRPKRTLGQVIPICEQVGALGVAVAHSGTYVGLLLSPDAPRYAAQVREAYQALSALGTSVGVYHTLTFEEGG